MSPKEFEAWRGAAGLTLEGAASALGIPAAAVAGYGAGTLAPIPQVVQLACAAVVHGLGVGDWKQSAGGRSLEARTNSLRLRLLQLFPEFADYLDGSYFSDSDRLFTPCGLLSEFSSYYRERIRESVAPPVVTFFALIEEIFAADPRGHDLLANAVATCFLENISSTMAGEAGRKLMGPTCAAFFDGWHRAP